MKWICGNIDHYEIYLIFNLIIKFAVKNPTVAILTHNKSTNDHQFFHIMAYEKEDAPDRAFYEIPS